MGMADGAVRRPMLRAAQVGIATLAYIGAASAQDGRLPWQEYGRLMENAAAIAPLDAGTLFGDTVDLYSGALSFAAVDVAIPGNGSLPVAVGRKLSIVDRYLYPASRDYAFADWDLDIPNVSGVFAGTWHDSRCSQPVPPDAGSTLVQPDEYWAGNHASMPGGGEMLRADVERTKPTTGTTYSWVTEGNVYFSCLSSIANGSGEGFLAIASDGTKYWFNYMAQYAEPSYTKPAGTAFVETITRRRNVLYATRVEDRYGNWVTYSYSNAATGPVKLTQVSASDGRTLTLQYNTSGYVSSISDGSRTWSYQYSGYTLSKVVLPDASSWSLNLSALSNAAMQYDSEPNAARSCFSLNPVISGDVSGSMTHPSGATATFVVGPSEVGLTNVPGLCRNYQPPSTAGGTTNDDFPIIPFRWTSLVARSKRIEGPGLTPAQWDYSFQSGKSWVYPPGQTTPVCTTTTCLDPVCKSDDCAGTRRMTISGPEGEWRRYTFGNSYRYNEGKLLMQESGASASSILKTVLHTYNFATSGQPYPAKIGSSPQSRGAGFVSEYPRPRVMAETYQDDALFVWKVDTGCSASGVYCLDGLARPLRVVRAATLSTTTTGSDPVLPPAAAPTLTVPATNATGNYSLGWTSISLASWYELQERLGTAAWDTIQSSGATTSSVGGKPSGSWSYQVRACNVAGCSAWSAIGTTVVTLPPTGVPALSTPATSTTGAYTVSWTTVEAATRYELEQRKDGGAWAVIQNTSATSLAFTTQAIGSYDYRVRACNAGGCAGYSSTATTVVPQSLGAPTLTVPSSIIQGEATSASWTAVSGATRYVLERNRNGGTFTVAYDGTATSASVTLDLAGSYKFRVKACNAYGCSAYSTEKTVTVTTSTAALGGDATRLIAMAAMEVER